VKAKVLLASIRPRDEMGRLRRRLAADQLADLVALDKKLAAVEAEIRAMVKRTPTRLPDIYGIGPVITATVIGEVGNVAFTEAAEALVDLLVYEVLDGPGSAQRSMQATGNGRPGGRPCSRWCKHHADTRH
jgi:hypothetical protein